jgi:hypothetical protein
MSEKKILNIDPNLFNFSNNSTRKKRTSPDPSAKIRMKVNKPKKNETLKKRSILNMIRKHQESQYKDRFENNINSQIETNSINNYGGFNDTKEFFKNLEENANKQIAKNHTLKTYPSHGDANNIHTTLPSTLTNVANTIVAPTSFSNAIINQSILPVPKYGCLKNGTLPTYRTIMNQTRKHIPETNLNVHPPIIGGSSSRSIHDPRNSPESFVNANGINNQPHLSRVNNVLESTNIKTKLNNYQKNNMKKRKMKRKKTTRRTYKIGRSKILPKVSVLVSNKTIRNNIRTKAQLLKQVPLHEMRRFLIKHGFIRVGSTTPSDVLRKMYETSMLMCGEIQNHNPDNLLYNFIHDTDT